jgi:hypothetical protein
MILMPTPLIGDRPMTVLERQQRWRERERERAALAQQAVAFVRHLRPDVLPPAPRRALTALQRKLEEMR